MAAEFSLHGNFKLSRPSTEMDDNIEMVNQFGELGSSMLENINITDFSAENFLFGFHYQQTDFPLGLSHNFPGASHSIHAINLTKDSSHESEKTKAKATTESSSEDAGSTASAIRLEDKKKSSKMNGLAKETRRKSKRKQDKPEEVIHVRAKRGQATDSHSLAERVRREKINNKLRCLQDLVPGCQKTMGLVTMLDEIISYVHSLQNQVEFLSMELEAACSYQLS